MSANNNQQAERRSADRFPMDREVRFSVMNRRGGDEAGEGKTINMSSSGVLISSSQMLLPGRRLELAISWPAQLNNKVALKLVARGRVVRYEHGYAAVEIQQYEFRTQSAAAAGRMAVQ